MVVVWKIINVNKFQHSIYEILCRILVINSHTHTGYSSDDRDGHGTIIDVGVLNIAMTDVGQ